MVLYTPFRNKIAKINGPSETITAEYFAKNPHYNQMKNLKIQILKFPSPILAPFMSKTVIVTLQPYVFF
jgi:hypothetical protein